ncbi:MAG TPA: hypothetical protein EYH06_08730 [Chromatiales bacterium]|nr:hypothetical protein [Thiotrichales bacterium]HIP68660.1 hypothetical protein [Chromatiales bacterium]
MNRFNLRQLVTTASLALLLTACGGGGGGGGIGGTGITRTTTSGVITGFGSIFVNGIEFETGSASITVDDNTAASESDLSLGMVVTITGTEDASGTTGSADTVVFDDSIEGPVEGAIAGQLVPPDPGGQTKTFTILDQTVVVDKTTTVFDDTTFDTLAVADVLEVSGFVDAAGIINATRVEKKSVFIPGVGTQVELKGVVSNLDTDPNVRSFSIGTIVVNYPSTTEFEDMTEAELVNGLFVEVKGIFDGTEVVAEEIEKEDEGFGSNVTKVSIEGLITNFVSESSFKIQGQAVDASNATLTPTSLMLANGVKVEAEGPIENGILKATKVEQRGGDLKLETKVQAVDAATGNVTLEYPPDSALQLVNVTVTSSTLLKDQNQPGGTFSLGQLLPGEFVEVRAQVDGSGNNIASEMERDSEDDRILQGPLDENANQTTPGQPEGSVKILGVVVNTDATTQFEDENDNPVTADVFFAAALTGKLVKVKDDEPGDGVADEIALED